MTKDKALDLALEALKFALHVGFDESSESQIKKGDKAWQQHQQAITAIKQARALDKKAENARELGLDYGPVPENFMDALRFDVAARDAAPVQEPVATVRTWHMNGDQHAELGDWELGLFKLPDGEHTLYTTPPAQEFVCSTGLCHYKAKSDERLMEPWEPSDTAHRPGGLPQDFIKHEVENEGDWSEWVNPNSEQYFMKCCDCGLVHEMQFKVVKYSEGDECEFVDDPNVQVVFRARRHEIAEKQEDSLAQTNWDNIPQAFNDWWNADYDDSTNPFRLNSPAYWAWSGWSAANKENT